MATGRHDVDFEGVDPVVLSFKIDGVTIVYNEALERGSAGIDLAVNLVSARTVQLVSDAQPVLGKLLLVTPDGFCSVQVGGGTSLPAGLAAAVTAGQRIVGALGAAAAKGYIRNQAVATLAEVAVARHTIIDPTTATAVQVLLGA